MVAGLMDIVQYVSSVFVLIYNALDKRLFPDISLTYSQILLALAVLVLIFKLLFGVMGFGSNLSYRMDFSSFKKEKPRHGLSLDLSVIGKKDNYNSNSYTPRHGRR